MARIEHPPVGHLVLGLFARDTQLGMAIHQAQIAPHSAVFLAYQIAVLTRYRQHRCDLAMA